MTWLDMFNIPPKIKIGGHWIEIKYPYIYQERFDRYGQYDDAKKIIYLTNKDGNGEERARSGVIVSFIHEILHAVDINIGQHIFEGEDGEKKVEGLSEGIFQVLIDNEFIKR